MSVKSIAKELGVSRGSVSVWVRDIQLTQAQIDVLKKQQGRFENEIRGAKANRERFLLLRRQYQQQGREKARTGSLLHATGCMLYWAEGAKGRNVVIFANSDPHMISLFVQFLREEFGVFDEKIGVVVHCHTSDLDEHERIAQYWLSLLNLPRSSFKRIAVKQGSDTRKNRLINGVCRIEVNSTELVQHIYGAIQEYGGFTNEAWLF
jgi:transposase-like protein